MQTCEYLGATIEMWMNREAWFWRILRSNRDGGTIGAAATAAEAVRDACLSIEETASASSHADLLYSSAVGWDRSLTSLVRYLTCEAGASA